MNKSANNDTGFAGTLKNIYLNDVIQMCCLSAINMAICVTKGSKKGTIFIKDGLVIHAICGNIEGEKAFYRIMGWENGSFETLGMLSVPKPTINKNVQSLLMEAARIADEQARQINMPCKYEDKPGQSRICRVLIVDDSQMMCRILTDILSSDKDIVVAGTAKNGEEALKKIDELMPDLITLDVNMPVMDGSTTLKYIMINSPCPVVIISNISGGTHADVLDFLRLGAVEFIKKPTKTEDMTEQKQRLTEVVKTAASARISNFRRARSPGVLVKKRSESLGRSYCGKMVVLNSGAGGYAELIRLIPMLPTAPDSYLVVLQSMPIEFVSPLSDYLDTRSNMDILPIQAGAKLFGGRCYIGTNNYPLIFSPKEGCYSILTGDDLPYSDKKGNCFDYFLHSIADLYSGRVMVALLSGADTGDLSGLGHIKENNGRIIVQEVSSCMVSYPLEKAIRAGLVDKEADTDEIKDQIIDYLRA